MNFGNFGFPIELILGLVLILLAGTMVLQSLHYASRLSTLEGKVVELANALLYSSLEGKTIELPLDGEAYERKLAQLIKESKFEKKVVQTGAEDFTKSFNR